MAKTVDRASERRLRRVRNRLLAGVQDELKRGDITAEAVLGLLAHTTGACIAYQDQRTMTQERAMHIVAKNIEAGNREAMAEVASASGRPV